MEEKLAELASSVPFLPTAAHLFFLISVRTFSLKVNYKLLIASNRNINFLLLTGKLHKRD